MPRHEAPADVVVDAARGHHLECHPGLLDRFHEGRGLLGDDDVAQAGDADAGARGMAGDGGDFRPLMYLNS